VKINTLFLLLFLFTFSRKEEIIFLRAGATGRHRDERATMNNCDRYRQIIRKHGGRCTQQQLIQSMRVDHPNINPTGYNVSDHVEGSKTHQTGKSNCVSWPKGGCMRRVNGFFELRETGATLNRGRDFAVPAPITETPEMKTLREQIAALEAKAKKEAEAKAVRMAAERIPPVQPDARVPMTTLCVQIKGTPTAVRMKAEHVDENRENGELLAKDSRGQIIGRFKPGEIVGWWMERDE
jgi:hypothetical protein